ncbi:MAG: DoxX family protein [Gemmataceae bacterium]|nr:DoxX family protein [Gemmataceae bacterium]
MVKLVMRWLLALLLLAAGVLHFVRADVFLRAMPAYLPWHRELVLLSGAAEFLLGILLLVPRVSRPAAWGVVALFVAVFPANVHMALNPDLFPAIPPWVLWLRVPLQVPLVLWAWWLAK